MLYPTELHLYSHMYTISTLHINLILSIMLTNEIGQIFYLELKNFSNYFKAFCDL